ncbi:MAG: GNAT family N-acetyltransferase [Phycisphaerae bacterium]|nr:GNAT family N-acetyltransferase [Phycisphaerae bacterium]
MPVADASALQALRLSSLQAEPDAFCASPDDDKFRDLAFVRESLADTGPRVTFGAYRDTGDGERLVGMLGLIRNGGKRAHVAFVWGMYVDPSARGGGAGRALVRAAIARARTWEGVRFIELSVNSAMIPARTLYESAGFVAWGRDADSMRVDGRSIEMTHMKLDLERRDVTV